MAFAGLFSVHDLILQYRADIVDHISFQNQHDMFSVSQFDPDPVVECLLDYAARYDVIHRKTHDFFPMSKRVANCSKEKPNSLTFFEYDKLPTVKFDCTFSRTVTGFIYRRIVPHLLRQHYRELLSCYPNWELYKFYIDEGSAKTLSGRKAFMAMMNDAMCHRIDLIITRSLAKFSRNIKAGVGAIQELAGRIPPVGVLIESENIYSLSQEGKLALSFLLMIAEEESRKKSNALKD